jgi:hypothetical protein
MSKGRVMKRFLAIVFVLLLTSGCVPEDLTNTTELQAAIERCEEDTGQACVLMAVPEASVGEVWALYWVQVSNNDPLAHGK